MVDAQCGEWFETGVIVHTGRSKKHLMGLKSL
jgi:hypothetical protein